MLRLRKKRKGESIPVATMGDIAFLLMIFYMATTLITDQKPWDVPLPEVTGNPAPSPYPLVIYLDRSLASTESVYFFNRTIALESLPDEVKLKAAEAPAAVRVYLNIEKDLPFHYMNSVIDALKKAGIRNLVITTGREREE